MNRSDFAFVLGKFYVEIIYRAFKKQSENSFNSTLAEKYCQVDKLSGFLSYRSHFESRDKNIRRGKQLSRLFFCFQESIYETVFQTEISQWTTQQPCIFLQVVLATGCPHIIHDTSYFPELSVQADRVVNVCSNFPYSACLAIWKWVQIYSYA